MEEPMIGKQELIHMPSSSHTPPYAERVTREDREPSSKETKMVVRSANCVSSSQYDAEYAMLLPEETTLPYDIMASLSIVETFPTSPDGEIVPTTTVSVLFAKS